MIKAMATWLKQVKPGHVVAVVGIVGIVEIVRTTLGKAPENDDSAD